MSTSMQSKLVGYYDDTSDTPTYDPGLGVPCIVCAQPLNASPARGLRTTCVMPLGVPRSLFFRAHRDCWLGLSDEEQGRIESAVVDAAVLEYSLKEVA